MEQSLFLLMSLIMLLSFDKKRHVREDQCQVTLQLPPPPGVPERSDNE